MSMFETTATQAREDGWGDYDPEAVTCVDCGALLDEDEMVLGAFCRDCQPGVERVPAGVVRRYKDEGVGMRDLSVSEELTLVRMERDWLLGAWAAAAGIHQGEAEATLRSRSERWRTEAQGDVPA